MTLFSRSEVRWTRWLKIAIAVFVIMIIIFLSFGITVYSYLKNDAIQAALAGAKTDTARVTASLEENFSSVLTIYATMMADPSFIKNFSQIESIDSSDAFLRYQVRSRINSYLMTTANQNSAISSIYVYANGLYASHIDTSSFPDSRLKKTQWFSDVSPAISQNDQWISTYSFDTAGNNTEAVLAYCQRLNSLSIANTRIYGFFSVNLSLYELGNTMRHMGTPSTTYSLLLDRNRQQLVGIGEQSGFGALQYQEMAIDCLARNEKGPFIYSSPKYGDLVVSLAALSNGDFYYASFVPMEKILQSTYRVRNFFIIMSVLVLALVEVLILFCLFITYQPIFKLLHEMKRFQNGCFDSYLTHTKNDEIQFIYSCYNDMVAHINRLIKDTYEQTSFKQQAEIKILQIQINQHFLYNTLEAIYWLCKKDQPLKAGDLVLKLSNYYRLFLSNGIEIIALREVVQMLRDYADIVLVRHDHAFTIDLLVDESLLEYRVCKTIFQPFLENAVLHGVERRITGGRVEIVFGDNGNQICYSVSDNGPGIEPDILKTLNTMPEYSFTSPNKFFALQCINYQMKLLYGDQYTFCLDSVPLHGTTATILIPKKFPPANIADKGEYTYDV